MKGNETRTIISLDRFLQCFEPSHQSLPLLTSHFATAILPSYDQVMSVENDINLSRPLLEIYRIVNPVHDHVFRHLAGKSQTKCMDLTVYQRAEFPKATLSQFITRLCPTLPGETCSGSE